jgi:hypothetical protein
LSATGHERSFVPLAASLGASSGQAAPSRRWLWIGVAAVAIPCTLLLVFS